MDKLTPTARLTLDALSSGPANVHELCERTGRSRSATDRAIGELAKADLITKLDDGGDAADGAPTRWQPAISPVPESSDPPVVDAEPDKPLDAAVPGDDTAQAAEDRQPETSADGDVAPTSASEAAEQPKLCRGCQAQMPTLCQACWQKTPAYCGTCRKDMPQILRGEPGEPVILSNGLPKLRPGEREQLIINVMREHPVPNHVGITGWTGSRVAIFLPGRSPSAINNALEKFSRNGTAELIGDKPMRYRLKTNDEADNTDTTS
jgi:hypothetical protein